jgi:hypothetical protein
VPYASRPLPGFEASQAAVMKQKAEVSKKPAAKNTKASPSKTLLSRSATPPPKPGHATNVVKMAWPKVKPGLPGMSEIELTITKPVGVSKKFCLLDVAALRFGDRALMTVLLVLAALWPRPIYLWRNWTKIWNATYGEWFFYGKCLLTFVVNAC